ncbi:ABC transporter permease [Paraburkholderia caballeronis]|uniref:Peptide/nickel transport system permease protein n=1 Tax=Paraburkholderia caballeronis TaxID=416943 RepID=A0A1H7MNU5_9BURK|nr:ABC transporter permease [Paraburkholderia caballeronis]PXW26489.1 peptide/nickel transport system permease protein [Paraburkholderia caballeronis]PXX02036.1 peptide/nickel transport system permease protein [Paraburkholderia caballeronis]RAK01193.1 peptide/nickel transport system permease protein [Paraburkholderia caballeronis]TDV16242.1 peptide/nickel transport system permease protein [Paraburkholderia caballeronis]TDV20592.1 peptide/nickel transport system permease protein [Paraburkholder
MNRSSRIASVLRRTAWQALPTVLGIVVLNFLLLRLMPGDAADVMAGEAGSATAETMHALRAKFGLDQTLLHQLGAYLNGLAHLSLGYSPRFDTPVMTLILSRLPNTLLLMGVALGFAIVAGIALGAVMAHWAGKWPDRVLSVLALVFYSTPGFWIGLLAIVLFSVRLGWLPSGGNLTIGASLTGFAYFVDAAKHVVLPALTLSTFFIAIYARLTRAAMLEVQRQDFVRTAQAKGLSPARVTVRHVLRNALVPLTTLAGLHFGTLLGGAAVTETVFSWPGLGRLALDAVMGRDFNVLLGVLLLSSLLVIAANVAVDLVQAWLDPRIG